MSEIIQVNVIVKGRVQGVYYRLHTREAAIEKGVTGYVKNCPDRSVEAVFQGSPEQVDAMVQWCHSGSPASAVSSVTRENVSALDTFNGFEIRY